MRATVSIVCLTSSSIPNLWRFPSFESDTEMPQEDDTARISRYVRTYSMHVCCCCLCLHRAVAQPKPHEITHPTVIPWVWFYCLRSWTSSNFDLLLNLNTYTPSLSPAATSRSSSCYATCTVLGYPDQSTALTITSCCTSPS